MRKQVYARVWRNPHMFLVGIIMIGTFDYCAGLGPRSFMQRTDGGRPGQNQACQHSLGFVAPHSSSCIAHMRPHSPCAVRGKSAKALRGGAFSRFKPSKLTAPLRNKDSSKDGSSKPKFLWGDDYFPISLYFLSMVFASVVVGVPLSLVRELGPGIIYGMRLSELQGVVMCTCGYFWMYYNVLGTQVSYRLQNKGKVTASGLRATERATGNTLEQMVPFLMLLWLYATYVDVSGAACLGWTYTLARAVYGALWGIYGQFTVLVEFSTNPAYAVLLHLSVGLLSQVIFGQSLVTMLSSLAIPAYLFFPLVTLLLQLGFLIVGWGLPFGFITAKIVQMGCEEDEVI